MDRTLTVMMVSLLLLAPVTGCLSGVSSPTPDSDGAETADDGRSAENLSRQELQEGAIAVEPDAGTWASMKFTTDQLFGNKTKANLTIAHENATEAQPWVALILHVEPMDSEITIPFFQALSPEPNASTLEMERSEGFEQNIEIALLVGSNEASTDYYLGLTENGRVSGPNSSLALEKLKRRPTLDVAADARGEGGGAGRVTVRNQRMGSSVVERGMLNLSWEDPGLPLEAQNELTVTGQDEITSTGIGSALGGGFGQAGAGEWSVDLTLPPVSLDESGRHVDPLEIEAVIPHEIADELGLDQPTFIAATEVEPGSASLDYSHTYTGALRAGVVLWGWASLDVEEVYGWNATKIVAA